MSARARPRKQPPKPGCLPAPRRAPRSQGLGAGIDYFGGSENSTIRFERAPRWRPVCTNSKDALASGRSWPRPPEVPGNNTMGIADVCFRGQCYPDSLIYKDFGAGPGRGERRERLGQSLRALGGGF